jgi:hypothetical protein
MPFAARLVLSLLLLGGVASAQETDAPAEDLFGQGLVAPTLDFEVPAESFAAPVPYTPGVAPTRALPQGPRHDLVLEARLVEEGDPLTEGLIWRVFGTRPDADNRLPLLAEAAGGSTTVKLPAGDYLVHAGFGRAGATKRVTITDDDQMESLVLNAGGLKLDAVVGNDRRIPPEDVTFEVLQNDESGDLITVVPNAKPDRVLRLSAGSYHVVSRYGGVNAIVRADIEVEAGKLTEASMRHSGAAVTLKLVSAEGGEAIANTSWTVTTQDGNTLHESTGAFPSIVLAAGSYTAVATHQGHIYSRDFAVEAGVNRDIEVRLADLTEPETAPARARQ